MNRTVPWVMVYARALLGPGIVLLARSHTHGIVLSATVLFCLVDDILDGILARRWGTATSALRLADSAADTIFYLGVARALWLRFPAMLRVNGWWLVALFGLEGVRYVFDFWKFGKGASYHSYLAKAWGLVIATAMVCAFLGIGWLIRTAIIFGIAVNLEGFAMSLMLPSWRNDVKTLFAAWRLRREMIAVTARC